MNQHRVSQTVARRPEVGPDIELPDIRSPADAALVCTDIEATMEALLQFIEAETTLLRSGQGIAACELEPRKRDYARQYMDDLATIRAIGPILERFAPESVARLRRLHDEFRSVLQINMAALATAKAVSDSRRAPPLRGSRGG